MKLDGRNRPDGYDLWHLMKTLKSCVRLACWCGVVEIIPSVSTLAALAPVGERPYEMVWACQTNDTRPPLIDFENLDGWTVTTNDAVATLSRSREQQLWGDRVAKIVYRAAGKAPKITLKPPQPVPVKPPFDSVNLWLYGNNWSWTPDATTPPVEITVLLRSKTGQAAPVKLGSVRWKEWWLMHHKLSAEQSALLKDGATFEGIQIANGKNKEDRSIYLDNLAIYQEELAPLSFPPRRQRGVDPFPGQSAGINNGPGKLPFPTREETILPDNLVQDFKVSLAQAGHSFVFTYRGSDGQLEYRYEPKSGTLSDVSARWLGRGSVFQPLAKGGVQFASTDKSKSVSPDKLELLRCERVGDTVVSQWRCSLSNRTAEVAYTFRLWQKSLVVDVKCLGGDVGEFQVGQAVGIENPRLVTLPYMAFAGTRPAVLVAGPTSEPLFIFALLDYYRSNGSSLWARNEIASEGVAYNGGSRYLPKTDGRRNDCFERLFLTVSPRFEEVLPNIPNPKSPWMSVAGERLWIAHGASNRTNDYARWRDTARYGMTNIVITDHETGWRDGGESFTFRTRAAPGKGGDDAQADYARRIRALGFRYGIYNNYTDYAPVNEFWNEDMVSRQSDGQWRMAWPRCYNPKPACAVEYEARLAPIIQEKFHLDTAYCDVHTAVAPWEYVDFDSRVPGGGTFAATLYAYGEIMLHQKATWNGPVYSEGSHHWFYCGLTDGNYGQDQTAHLPVNPWLVDFDLRKLHPLCCNFGMGNWDMFYGQEAAHGATKAEKEAMFDRFLAATLAFGHTGFFISNPAKSDHGVRSYFALQQIFAHYSQSTAEEIRYANEAGQLLDVSAAVATGAYRRSQIATRYANGLRVLVNGHPTETWKTADAELPPNGWFAQSADKKLVAWSALVDGHRADYVDSPAYLYADGRGQFTRFPKLATDGQLIVHRQGRPGQFHLIPLESCTSFGVASDGMDCRVDAHDGEGKCFAIASHRHSRHFTYVTPVSNAFSYHVYLFDMSSSELHCDRERVVPGEVIKITGLDGIALHQPPREFNKTGNDGQTSTIPGLAKSPGKFSTNELALESNGTLQVPANAKPGTRLWQSIGGKWLDFTVVPLVETKLSLADKFHLELTGNMPQPVSAQVTFDGQTQTASLKPQQTTRLEFPFAMPTQEVARPLSLRVTAGELQHEEQRQLKAKRSLVPAAPMPERYQTGQCLRKKTETSLDPASGAQARPQTTACGEVSKRGLFMHPPYQGGTGYSFALYDPVALPGSPLAAFRCDIGKMDGSDRGDGILFRVLVIAPDGKETVVAERQWAEHAWTPLEADLARWAGQTIRLKLIADPGPADNSSGDWAAWATLRLESKEPLLQVTVGR